MRTHQTTTKSHERAVSRVACGKYPKRLPRGTRSPCVYANRSAVPLLLVQSKRINQHIRRGIQRKRRIEKRTETGLFQGVHTYTRHVYYRPLKDIERRNDSKHDYVTFQSPTTPFLCPSFLKRSRSITSSFTVSGLPFSADQRADTVACFTQPFNRLPFRILVCPCFVRRAAQHRRSRRMKQSLAHPERQRSSMQERKTSQDVNSVRTA